MADDSTSLRERLKKRLKKRAGGTTSPTKRATTTRCTTTRCTVAESERRLTQTVEWLVKGHGRQSIIQMASAAWGVGERQIDNYLAKAYAVLREENESEREQLTALATAQRDHLYRLALEAAAAVDAGDRASLLSAARAILTDRDRLRALYATDRASLARAGLDKALAEAGLSADATAADLLRTALRDASEG